MNCGILTVKSSVLSLFVESLTLDLREDKCSLQDSIIGGRQCCDKLNNDQISVEDLFNPRKWKQQLNLCGQILKDLSKSGSVRFFIFPVCQDKVKGAKLK